MPPLGPRKYEPLRDYLAGLPAAVGELTLALSEIEAILGTPLPPAALRPRVWWANDRAIPQARAWLAAGWRAGRPNFRRAPPTVTFDHAAPARPTPTGAPERAAPAARGTLRGRRIAAGSAGAPAEGRVSAVRRRG